MLLQHFSSCCSEIFTASANEMMNMSWSPPCCVNLRNTGRSSSTSWCSHHHASLKNWAQCLVSHSDSTVRSLAWGWRAEKIVLLMVVCGTFSLLPCCWVESMMWDLRWFTSPEMISCCSMSMLRKQVLCGMFQVFAPALLFHSCDVCPWELQEPDEVCTRTCCAAFESRINLFNHMLVLNRDTLTPALIWSTDRDQCLISGGGVWMVSPVMLRKHWGSLPVNFPDWRRVMVHRNKLLCPCFLSSSFLLKFWTFKSSWEEAHAYHSRYVQVSLVKVRRTFLLINHTPSPPLTIPPTTPPWRKSTGIPDCV